MTAIIELITQQPFLGAQGADPQDQTALIVVASGLFDGPDEGLRQFAHACFFWDLDQTDAEFYNEMYAEYPSAYIYLQHLYT